MFFHSAQDLFHRWNSMKRRLVPTHNLILNLCCNHFPTPDPHIIVINNEFTCSIYLALVNAVHDQYQICFSFHSNKKIKQKELLFSTDMFGMMSLLHLLRRKTLFFSFPSVLFTYVSYSKHIGQKLLIQNMVNRLIYVTLATVHTATI